MTDDPFHYVRLANGMRVNEAARYLADLHSTKTALTPSEQELLAVAEGLLELVRQGTTVFMDSAAIEADLYDTALPEAPTATRPRPSDALRTCDRAALQVIFDRYGITDVQVFGSVARGADQPGSDLDLLFFGPDNFSAFTMIDLADDLEALLGVPVDLVSNHPTTRRGICRTSPNRRTARLFVVPTTTASAASRRSQANGGASIVSSMVAQGRPRCCPDLAGMTSPSPSG